MRIGNTSQMLIELDVWNTSLPLVLNHADPSGFQRLVSYPVTDMRPHHSIFKRRFSPSSSSTSTSNKVKIKEKRPKVRFNDDKRQIESYPTNNNTIKSIIQESHNKKK